MDRTLGSYQVGIRALTSCIPLTRNQKEKFDIYDLIEYPVTPNNKSQQSDETQLKSRINERLITKFDQKFE